MEGGVLSLSIVSSVVILNISIKKIIKEIHVQVTIYLLIYIYFFLLTSCG